LPPRRLPEKTPEFGKAFEHILALGEELPLRNRRIVGREERPRTLGDGLEVLPWQEYLDRIEAL
jgi:hypothetical protein